MRGWTAPPPHVHHMTFDLAEFLEGIGEQPPRATGATGVRPLAPTAE